MSLVQRFFKAISSPSRAAAMQAESRRWIVQCPCGHASTVWDLGGIRWKASGSPRMLLTCPQCGRWGWKVVTRQTDNA
jgi:hypothetical protein